jgi:hypothetical protein
MPSVELESEGGFRITLTKDMNIYENMEEENKEFLERIKYLEE